jgi:hypothetical protein
MFQIMFKHLFCHLSNCSPEITSYQKISPTISLLQMRKFLEQSTCRFTFDPPHNLNGCHGGRGAHQNMDMILVDYTSYDPYFKSLTDLTNHCTNSFSNFTCQYFVAIFGNLNKVILNLKNLWLPYL